MGVTILSVELCLTLFLSRVNVDMDVRCPVLVPFLPWSPKGTLWGVSRHEASFHGTNTIHICASRISDMLLNLGRKMVYFCILYWQLAWRKPRNRNGVLPCCPSMTCMVPTRPTLTHQGTETVNTALTNSDRAPHGGSGGVVWIVWWPKITVDGIDPFIVIILVSLTKTCGS